MAVARDPRDIITPDAFTVAPELLGLPLARPARRAFAMIIDLALVAFVIKAASFTIFVLAAALLLFRMARPPARGGTLRRTAAWGVRIWAAILVGVFGVMALDAARDFVTRPRFGVAGSAGDDAAAAAAAPEFSIADARVLRHLADLERADDSAVARASAQRIAAWIRDRSATSQERTRDARWLLDALAADVRHGNLLAQELAPLLDSVPRQLSDTTAVAAYLAALERGDTAQAAALVGPAQIAIAGDRIGELERAAERLRAQRDTLAAQAERRTEARGFRGFLAGIADDLGVGFGWMAVYFTAFVVLWRGQTPGKRLLGLRIIRLDAKPLSWWLAFERFGGYAASFSTGLLGFAQILWDANRQGMHDKFIATVVIRERGSRADGAPPADHSAPLPPRVVPPGSRLPE